MDADTDYLKEFEERLLKGLIELCSGCKMLDGVLLSTEDVDSRWESLALDYMADAVAQINEYPGVAVAWAGYLGAAMAHLWDADWIAHGGDEYKTFYGTNGFDDMDEYIVRNIMGLSLDSPVAKNFEEVMRRCAYFALNIVRHENIEPQSPMAYYVFARVVKTMYRIGASIELKRLGYKFEKVNMGDC